MQVPAPKIVRLMQSDRPPEVRRAAAVVLGEVGGRDAEVAKALRAALADDDPAVRVAVIGAVGNLRVEAALPDLLERIKAGGEEAEAAAHAAARLGAKGIRGLHDLTPRVSPGLRRYIAAALAAHGAAGSGAEAVAVLRDK